MIVCSSGFPVFSYDPVEGIVSDSPSGVTGYFPDGTPSPSVSGGDASVLSPSPDVPLVSPDVSAPPALFQSDSAVLAEIQADVERLLYEQASSSGYLSSSALDVFDRVVGGHGYDYYCAFRYDADSYNALMYLSDSVSSSGSSVVLEDSVSVRLYRTYNSSTRVYDYHYSVSSAGDVSVSLSGDLMYYTNCADGYPVLGGVPAPGRYPPALLVLLGAVLLFAVFSFFRRRR